MKTTLSIVFCMTVFLFAAEAQNKKTEKQAKADAKKAEVETWVQNKSFVFTPTSMSPMRGGTRQVNYSYSLKINNDSMTCYLPYFGRATNVDYGSNTGGLDFKSASYEYVTAPRKKGGWTVSIKPKDVNDPREMIFTISENGYTTLNVNSNNRDPISFNGEITAVKVK